MTDARSDKVLVGQSLVSFSFDMSENERNDILDCLNYCETRADRKYDRHGGWKKWINRYQAGLYNNGFKLSGALDSNTVQVSHIREVPEVLRTAIQTSGHPRLAALGHATLERMLGSSHAQSFFQRWFSAGLTESLQVVPCQRAPSGDIEVLICGVRLVTERIEGAWFQAPHSSMMISVDGGAYLFNEQAYGPYREKVESALVRYTRIYFDSLAAT